jgi:hypothetical protein
LIWRGKRKYDCKVYVKLKEKKSLLIVVYIFDRYINKNFYVISLFALKKINIKSWLSKESD